jgi:hypothetical protein
VNPASASRFTVKVRVPGWAQGQAVPGDLYSFEPLPSRQPVTLKLNGQSVPLNLENGYATVTRVWHSGDFLDLHLPMPIERVQANDKVTADRNRVALQRGPIVFCAEWPDSPDKHVRNLVLSQDQDLRAEFDSKKLNGITVIHGTAVAYRYDQAGQLQHSSEAFSAIPYYAWANRGPGQMEVWIAETETAAHPVPFPTLASQSKVTVSGQTEAANGRRSPRLVADQEEPSSSSDPSSQYNWWPKKGTTEWIQYEFATDHPVSSADVYWFVEADGDVQLPASWRVLYLSGTEWKPVENLAAYGLQKDQYNHVSFKPVITKAMRLEVTLAAEKSAGVSEWKVQP